jgi:Glu-tRNA(Gln) amidotransferase subunit E-like FAD-binding protein
MIGKKIGLKVGLEIHFQLDTKHKLFCNCSTEMKEKVPITTLVRKLHPVASELGQVDAAAQFEYLRDREFHYHVFKNETCLVEVDCEPPHNINPEALQIALQIALLLNCKIPDEIHIMRKTVIDGSNPSGFQRTAIVGFNGYLDFKGRKILITQVTIEEDAAAKVSEDGKKVVYRLNRLGVPLVEIDTDILENFSPEEIQDIAYTIGLIVRSTEKVKKAIGAIRQDVNVSVEKGARVEIKGIQSLGLISKTIEEEVERQLKLVEKGMKVEPETRATKPDGTTEFMRPLPGANRMYPESDLPPIVTASVVREAKKSLPEPIDKKLKRYRSYKFSEELINGLLKSDYFFTFESFVKRLKVEPKLIANVLANITKDLKRRGFCVDEEKIFEVLKALEEKKIVKESVPDILAYLSEKPGKTVEAAVKELKLMPLSEEEVKKVVEDILESGVKDFETVVKIVMSKVRGKAEAQVVIKAVKNVIKDTSMKKDKC